ncbi:pyridoxal phosphate-dependent aminotransferase [Candidatus Gottesmanbacteria bacterium]|nr:pyridoxal phosphate-dependent aminotransferase [Candidatus Gottesmanbacteria bacterium]
MLTKRILRLQPSATFAIDGKVKSLQAAGISVVNLTLGEPDFVTPKHIRKAAIRAITDGFTHYAPIAGIFELKEAVAKKLLVENGISYQPSEIVIGVGTKQLLYSAFQSLCQKGDEVIVAMPTWNTYIEQIKLAEAAPVCIPLLPPFKLTANMIEKHCNSKTKVILLNSPANPTGAVIEKKELEKIAQLAIERQIFVLSDEIYEKLIYERKHVSIASLGEKIKDLTLTINGFSKSYAMTGWRVGYAAGPKPIVEAMIALAGQTTSGTCSISQKAALHALSGSKKTVEKMVGEFKKRRNYIYTALRQIQGIVPYKTEGAFYAFCSIEKLLNQKYKTSQTWCEALLEKGKVAVIPGEAFYAPGFIPISFAKPISDLRKGVGRIKKFIEGEK